MKRRIVIAVLATLFVGAWTAGSFQSASWDRYADQQVGVVK